jgi:hypothetical protein
MIERRQQERKGTVSLRGKVEMIKRKKGNRCELSLTPQVYPQRPGWSNVDLPPVAELYRPPSAKRISRIEPASLVKVASYDSRVVLLRFLE